MRKITHWTLRLCRNRNLYNKRLYCIQPVVTENEQQKTQKISEESKFASLYKQYKDKIVFNSYLDHDKLKLGNLKYYTKMTKKARAEERINFKEKSLKPLPIYLQYCEEKESLFKEESGNSIQSEKTFHLPFSTTQLKVNDEINIQNKIPTILPNKTETKPEQSDIDKWMTNYEYFDDTILDEDDGSEDDTQGWQKYYGTPNPEAGVSQVPCGGCGALLHCSDPSIPGYLPSEILTDRNENELKTMECQRCHFLKEYNIALDVTVPPEEYEKLLSSIRFIKSLVVLMIDLLDYPCSIWPGIVNVIGTQRPIIIVGNKVDLVPSDSIGYLKRIKESLMVEINETELGKANIKQVLLISAKTGYGIEDLISAMFKHWLGKGHVFLVGCTNVGKSSLFNALLQSDYCKVHAIDIVQRATVSTWPGTTLNFLKFPINRPSGWKIYQRTKRLQSEAKLMKIEKEIRKAQLQGRKPKNVPALIGHIGRTFSDPERFTEDLGSNPNRKNMLVLDENDEIFRKSKWFYDTPGIIHPDQVLSLLTTEELLLTIPTNIIRPQTYYLYKGSTIFIGGLARIDHVDCEEACRFTIFCSDTLPITVTKTEDADIIYDKFLGTELFAVPSDGLERLNNWPGLQKRKDLIEFQGEGTKISCGDVVLSSIAWVSVTANKGTTCKIAAWTPEARGIHRRYPPILRYSVNMKGKRIIDTPAYMVGRIFSE